MSADTHPAALACQARWWHLREDGSIQCDLCPRHCHLHPDQHGACFVRQRSGDELILTTYGRSSGFCIDPVEKKPLYHFYPGSSILSFGTAGCNLACRFCQNWDISKSRSMDRLMDQASPQAIARTAATMNVPSVAFTYNDPVIFAEYAIDIAHECHTQSIHTVAVTAGYIDPEPRREFFAVMDAANIDLKGFTDDFYVRLCGGHLAPVLDALVWVHHESPTWLEITTLLIPGANDGAAEIQAMCRWIMHELGADVPLHFTAFHPDYKLTDLHPTPLASLQQARRIAQDEGLHYVYTGNVRDAEGTRTTCPHCHAPLIERDGYAILTYRLTPDGHCPDCGRAVSGHFATQQTRSFGNQRVPIRLAGHS